MTIMMENPRDVRCELLEKDPTNEAYLNCKFFLESYLRWVLDDDGSGGFPAKIARPCGGTGCRPCMGGALPIDNPTYPYNMFPRRSQVNS